MTNSLLKKILFKQKITTVICRQILKKKLFLKVPRIENRIQIVIARNIKSSKTAHVKLTLNLKKLII